MRVLLDECLPRKLRRELPGHEVLTVVEAGWGGSKNGELLRRVASTFDVLLTVMTVRTRILSAALLFIGGCKTVPAHPLDGEWFAELVMDSAAAGQSMPELRTLSGRVVFDPQVPGGSTSDAERTEATGRTGFDLTRFFGQPYAADVSTTVMGPVQEDFFREVSGWIRGDTVRMIIIPRMSHGGLSLRGRLSGDSITGRWRQNAYERGASGRFVFRRVPRSAVSDSIIKRARRIDRESRLAGNREERERRRRVGYLRLRALDLGSGRYVPVQFAFEGHESNADGGSYAISFAAGDGGWGEYHELEPGRYDVIVYEFPCRGEEVWMDLEDAAPRVTVEIRSRNRVSQDIRLHLDSLRSSFPAPGAPQPCVASAH